MTTNTPALLIDLRLQQMQLASQALQQFRVIFSAVKKHLSDTEAICGISSSQLWVLYELNKAPGIKVTELAANLAIHQSTASNLVEKLVKKELIEKRREDIDQRVVRLSLTAKGEGVVLNAPASPRGILRDALDDLNLQTLMQLNENLAALVAEINSKDDSQGLIPLADL
jgi:DNA-binding MarR family transcriptional regulator